MYIQALIENTTKQAELLTEHGLSLYMEVGKHKLLFDMGQSDAFLMNAQKLGIDLCEVDIAILSHGHYDHGGGLESFLAMNKKAMVYINEHAFAPCFSGLEKEIGINPSLVNHPRVIVTQDHTVIDEGISLHTGNELPRIYSTESVNLFRQVQGKKEIDTFMHEQYLLVENGGERIVVSGCSHKGIQNIMEWFHPDVLIGGFHYKQLKIEGDNQLRLQEAAQYLSQYHTQYYTCHCTGVSQYEYLKTIMGNQLQYIATGDNVRI